MAVSTAAHDPEEILVLFSGEVLDAAVHVDPVDPVHTVYEDPDLGGPHLSGHKLETQVAAFFLSRPK